MNFEALPFPYAGPDGLPLHGWLADGSGGKSAPGVLVAHEAPGVSGPAGNNVRRRAALLAEQGYVALALDMYGREFPLEETMSAHEEMVTTPGLILTRARSAYLALCAHPSVDPDRIAGIGFCQGGMTVTELVRAGMPMRAAIGFHPGLKRPAGSPAIAPTKAKVLMLVGDDDPVIPQEDRMAFMAEMKARQADWQLHLFGGVGHSFTEPQIDALGYPGFAYNAAADRRSWSIALDLLNEVFAGEE